MQITNLTREKIDGIPLRSITRKTIDVVGRGKLDDISLVLVDEKKIKEINKKYRGKNKPTDVLSFEDLNEIFICPSFVKKQAKLAESLFKNDLRRVLVHGILHLAGYEHEKNRQKAGKMKKLEDKILNLAGHF